MAAVTIDLEFMGAREVIACFLVPTDGGFVLLETGPGSTLGALEAGVETAGFDLSRLRAVFVTHVHLDHAGAAGELARRTGCDVWVHPQGIQHLADPSRLLASAARLYGDMMDTLWGAMLPVPGEQLHEAVDGVPVGVDGLEVHGWFTPGHAPHHVAWQVEGDVATGDVGGIRMPGCPHVLPPTPPPDIDAPQWRASLGRLRRLAPERLLVTHFGAHGDPAAHLDELERRLDDWAILTGEVLGKGGDRGDLMTALTQRDDSEMAAAGIGPERIALYRAACPMEMNAAGLARAWKQERL